MKSIDHQQIIAALAAKKKEVVAGCKGCGGSGRIVKSRVGREAMNHLGEVPCPDCAEIRDNRSSLCKI